MKMEKFIESVIAVVACVMICGLVTLIIGCTVIKTGQCIDKYIDRKLMGIEGWNRFNSILCMKNNTRILMRGKELVIEDFNSDNSKQDGVGNDSSKT